MRTTQSMKNRSGFTLLELLVVVVILAALAALVIPRLDWARDQANAAISASGATQLMNNIQTYKVSTGYYPGNWDSLLAMDEDDELVQYEKLFSHSNTLVEPFEVTAPMGPGSGTSGYATSLVHAGVYPLWDHDNAATDANATSGTPRTVYTTGTLPKVPLNAVTRAGANTWSQRIVNSVYPVTGTVPEGEELFIFGLGAKNDLVGKTLTSPPVNTAADAAEYRHYLAVFKAYPSTTKNAKLVAVLDSRHGTVSTNLAAFANNTPEN